MKITVVGLWHLGCVTAASLASLGHEVIGLDLDPNVITSLKDGTPPIYEPGLNELVLSGINAKKLTFSDNIISSVNNRDIVWIAYDVPVNEQGVANVDFIFNCVENILRSLRAGTCIVISSQLPVGSVRKFEDFTKSELILHGVNFCYIPENLRLGNALEIFLNPDRIVIGINNDNLKEILSALFEPITKNLIWMSISSAEMTKHAINSFLALSITFINELALICEKIDVKINEVEQGI